MDDLLHLVFEYRRLISRRDLMGGQLGAASEQRLLSLERLFGSDPEDRRASYRRRFARCDVRVPATISTGSRSQPVEIVNLGGGGVRVEPAPQLRAGDRALIRVVSPETRSIYHLPVRAGWVRTSHQDSSMGLPFVGMPERLPLVA